MEGLSYYFINLMNNSDYQAMMELRGEDQATRKLIKESEEELQQMMSEYDEQ